MVKGTEMGEAKRRMTDRWYGVVPKKGMGLVVSHLKVGGHGFEISGGLDPQELRFSLLFWDRLIWPTNNLIHSEGDEETALLEQVKILRRPEYQISSSGVNGSSLAEIQYRAMEEMNAREPGLWSLSQGERSFLDLSPAAPKAKGSMFELVNAIPVPDVNVPVIEILEFKEKRRDELLSLRIELENFVSKLRVAGDDEAALRKAVLEIEQACIAVLRVAVERKFPLRFASTQTSFKVDFGKLIGPTLLSIAAAGFGLPTFAAICAGLGAAFIKGDISLKTEGNVVVGRNAHLTHPYRYYSSFTSELLRA